jgi:hypothetical protein
MIDVICLPRLDGAHPRGEHLRDVVRMTSVADGPASQILERLAEIFKDDLVREIANSRLPVGVVVYRKAGMLSRISPKS